VGLVHQVRPRRARNSGSGSGSDPVCENVLVVEANNVDAIAKRKSGVCAFKGRKTVEGGRKDDRVARVERCFGYLSNS